jgi:hypothetical protein
MFQIAHADRKRREYEESRRNKSLFAQALVLKDIRISFWHQLRLSIESVSFSDTV